MSPEETKLFISASKKDVRIRDNYQQCTDASELCQEQANSLEVKVEEGFAAE